jgi:hypothetical protein
MVATLLRTAIKTMVRAALFNLQLRFTSPAKLFMTLRADFREQRRRRWNRANNATEALTGTFEV